MRMRGVWIAVLAMLAVGPVPAQQAPSHDVDPLAWAPPELSSLSQASAFHTDLTFDRRLLSLAGGLWEGGDPGVTAAIDKLNGLAVHNYHYAHAGMYDPLLVEGVRRAYAALGWQHMVLKPGAGASPHYGPSQYGGEAAGDPDRGAIDRGLPQHGATDLWVRFEHLQVTGAVVLFESPTNVALVAVSGNLSPLDLLHLRGHFGIPRFDGDRFAPQP